MSPITIIIFGYWQYYHILHTRSLGVFGSKIKCNLFGTIPSCPHFLYLLSIFLYLRSWSHFSVHLLLCRIGKVLFHNEEMVFNQNGLCPNPLLILLIGLIMINFVNFIVNWHYGLSNKQKINK